MKTELTTNNPILEWQCPTCECNNKDDIDKEFGPFLSVICNDCDGIFEESELTAKESSAWIDCLLGGHTPCS